MVASLVVGVPAPAGVRAQPPPNREPSFASSQAVRDIDENRPARSSIGPPVVAEDPDDDPLTYTFTGLDTPLFEIGASSGRITTKASFDYETRSEYWLWVSVSDGKDEQGTPDAAVDDTVRVRVRVNDLDEPGSVAISPARPRVGAVSRARLSDPDGVVRASWTWYSSTDRVNWEVVSSDPTRYYYEPTAADRGRFLRAAVSYHDGAGGPRDAEVVSASTVAEAEKAPRLSVTELVTGLSIPWDIAFTPDATMLFTQRDGTLSARLADGTVQTVSADLSDLYAESEAGLMAIAVDPAFSTNRRVYTCATHVEEPTPDQSEPDPETRVTAWTIDSGYTVATQAGGPLVDGILANSHHTGCRLRFGPQGHLWITIGDALEPASPQSLAALEGKVLRVDKMTGAGAPGNPFSTAPRVYSLGHRNPQGLDRRPGTNQMWAVEHGPHIDDEINLLVRGGNYGWDPVRRPHDHPVPLDEYDTSVPMTDAGRIPGAVEAKWSSGHSSLATSGGVFLTGGHWGVWQGRLAVASLKDRTLRIFDFSSSGRLLSETSVWSLDGTHGRLRTPMMGPDDALYLTTSEGGGRDKILRIVPTSNDAPEFPADETGTRSVDEGLPAGFEFGAPVRADDPDGDPVEYALRGGDHARFAIDASEGHLRTREELDHERRASYTFTVTAEDPSGARADLRMTVTVSDVDEEGSVTLSPAAPRVGATTTASLSDPDGGVSAATWEWESSPDGFSGWTLIAGATARSYRPVDADEGRFLRATATYTD
ncbi:MAG: PQQ-dependent sugar dehydrogenase, partial [Acidimicrobiaceae bacterium]|nr:PQQ-dependent sugar dehydrogenase [Acidimicrobiaceae bacterium]